MSQSASQPPLLSEMPPRAARRRGTAWAAWDADAGAHVLAAGEARYRVLTGEGHSPLLAVEGRLGEGAWQPLLREAGMRLPSGGSLLSARDTAARVTVRRLAPELHGAALTLSYEEVVAGAAVRRSLRLRVVGGALEIAVSAPPTPYGGFTPGPLPADRGRTVRIPGLPDPLLVLEGGFACVYPDRLRGQASAYHPEGSEYRPDLAGRSSGIEDVYYLTLSCDPLDPLPSLQRPPAPYRAALAGRITLDLFSDAPFEEDERLLRRLGAYGLRDVLLIYRSWQRYGYRRRGPALYPANPDRGRSDAFRRMLDAARDAGWLVALREEFASVTVDSPYRSEPALALGPDGRSRRSPAGGHAAIAAHRMQEFARLESGNVRRNYAPGAVFVDGHTAWNPETALCQVDARPGSPSGTEAQAIGQAASFLGFLRTLHEGPVVGAAGEGSARFDTFAAGLAEGVLRGPDAGAADPLLVDYEHAEVRPALLGIGAGTYRQFGGLAAGRPVEAGKVDWDGYRATTLALGHAGYVGNYGLRPGSRGAPLPGDSAACLVREYFLLHALQRLYLEARLLSVRYRRGAELVNLAAALHAGWDLASVGLELRYEGGLTVWVNRAARESWNVVLEDRPFEIPAGGFLASAPEAGLLAYSALVRGQRADCCRCRDYHFIDVRGANPRQVEGVTTDGGVVLWPGPSPERPDLVMVNARQLLLEEDEYRLSERGDLHLRHLSPGEIELSLLDSESGKPVHVSWPAWDTAWAGRGLEGWDETGQPLPAGTLLPTRTGPQLLRARVGGSYRIRALRAD